jgi:hypothetical protein
MRERYVGTCPFQIVVNRHLVQQGYTIISTSAFASRQRYSRYVDEDKTIGQVRSAGFDVVIYNKEKQCFIGAEVKPELSWNEFQRALGQVIVHLVDPDWRRRVHEGMIIMPLNRLCDSKIMAKKKELLKRFTRTLANCRRHGYRVSIKYLSVPSRIVQF